jgi:hypothetical protein
MILFGSKAIAVGNLAERGAHMKSQGHLPARRKASGKRRWCITALLSAGVFVRYIDRVNLSVAHNALTWLSDQQRSFRFFAKRAFVADNLVL